MEEREEGKKGRRGSVEDGRGAKRWRKRKGESRERRRGGKEEKRERSEREGKG